MSSIIDVANAAGLSTATVSRALRTPEKVTEATRARVMAAVEAVDYRPNLLARNLRSDRSFSVLVLVPGIANPFSPMSPPASNRSRGGAAIRYSWATRAIPATGRRIMSNSSKPGLPTA